MRQISATALAAVALAATARTIRNLRPVAPELRHPLLALGLPTSRLTLALVRSIAAAARHAPSSEDARLAVPGADGVFREALLYRPSTGASRGALLWIHGGGRVSGVPQFDDVQCRRLADEAEVVVLSVDYRLAPEHRFPAALDDCAAALDWFMAWCADNSVPPRYAVGGASAGGGLAAELAQRATDEGKTLLHQVLIYPMLDDRTLDSGGSNRGRLLWTPAANRFAWASYLGHPAGQPEQRRYAAAARREDLSGLPSAWIGVGDLDLFYEESCDYALRLRAAGVQTDLRIERGMYHGADAVPGVKKTECIRAFHTDMVRSLRRALDLAGARPPRQEDRGTRHHHQG